MSKEFGQYAKECWQWAMAGSWKWRNWVTALTGIALTALLLFTPAFYKSWIPAATKDWLAFVIPMVGFSVFLVRLAVFAPFFLWRRLKEEIAELTAPHALDAIEETLSGIESYVGYARTVIENELKLLERNAQEIALNIALGFIRDRNITGPTPFPVRYLEALDTETKHLNWPELHPLGQALATYLKRLNYYCKVLDYATNHALQRAQKDLLEQIRRVRDSHKLKKP